MDILMTAFNSAEDGDRILISFPDTYSFYAVSRWLSEQFGDPIWILWTDAAVERINHLGKKYGFPTFGEAVIIGSRKECEFLNVIGRHDVFDDPGTIMNSVQSQNRIIISLGINFLELFGYSLSKAIEILIEHEKGIMCTAIIGETPEKVLPFHDVIIEIKKSEDSFLSFHTYIARMRFSMEGGVAEVGDVLPLNE